VNCTNYNIKNITANITDIALQIATLLNTNNNLKKHHSINTIINSRVIYFVEIHLNTVIGCVGLLDVGPVIDKIIHLSVLNIAQKRGIGSKLIGVATDASVKEQILMQVRNDNIASLRLAYMNGFEAVSCAEKFNYSLFNLYMVRV